MLFTIDPRVFADFPALTVYGLRARGLKTTMKAFDARAHLSEAAASLGLSYEVIAAHPQIVAWRDAYRLMGVKPSKYHCSIEALLRRVLKGADVATGFPAVDLYNSSSIRAIAPVGAYDCQKLSDQPVVLRQGDPDNDIFVPLGRNKSGFQITRKVVLYATGHNVLCWSVNCRDSQLTALEEHSDDVVFFSEGITSVQITASRSAISWLRQTLEELGTGCSETLYAHAESPSFAF